MTLDISAVTPRVQYTVGSTPDSTFDYSFAIFEDADISVYVGSTKKTLTTHYTVSGAGTSSGGTVTMTSGNAVSNATVTLVRNITIARTTDFPASGAFQVDSLNTELDRITAVQQELEDDIGRSLRLADEDATATLTIPLKDARKGRYLAFNSTTGNAEAGPTQTDVTAIADVTSDIALLADIQDGTTATNAITTVASNNSNVTTVAGISANVTTVAGISSDVTAVAGDATDIGAVAGKATEIGRLGTADAVADMALLGTSDVVADMALLATTDVIADMALLADADVISDMNTLATSDIISDLNTLATSDIVTDMNLLATSANVTAMGHLGTSANVTAMGHLGTSANVTAMGLLGTSAVVEDMGFLGTSANVTAMGLLGTSAVVEDMGFLGTSANVTAMGNLGTSTNVTNMANLNASGVISNISTVAGAVSNVNTVATNISGVNSFADRYRVASSAPTSSLDVGDLYFDTTANELKVYKSSGWSAAGSTVNGTSARFHYNISGTPTTVTGADANGNTLAYDAGFADVYVNGVRMSPDDITITSGTSVVFASALADGDDVDIVAFGTFNVANIVSTGALNSGSITSGFGNIDTGSSTITTTGAISGGTLTGTLQTASQTNITGVGALDAGSITSGFGAIDNGSSAITTTGAISGGTLTGTLQTASQPNITSVGTLTGFTSTGIDDNADAVAMTIDSSERVGIGLTTPLAKLDVNGTTDAELRITRQTASVSGASTDQGAVLNLYNDIRFENGYDGNATVGQILFTSMDDSTGQGIRAKIACNKLGYSHSESLAFYVSPGNTTSGQTSATSNSSGKALEIAFNKNMYHKSAVRLDAEDSNMAGLHTGGQAFYGEYDGGSLYVVKNRYYNGSSWVAKENGAGSAINMDTTGNFHWQHSPNVNAGQNATLSTRFTFTNEYAQWSSERNSLAFYIANSHSSDPHCLYLQFTGASPDDNTRYFLRCIDTSATRFTVFADGDIATADAGFISSDTKNKHTIKDATDKWEDVKKLKVRNFYWNEDYHPNKKNQKMIGFIAQEFETVFPKLVTELKDEEQVQEKDENGNETTVVKDLGTTTKHIKEAKLIPILTKALQEAMERIETLEAKVKALEEA